MTKAGRIDPLVHYSRKVRGLEAEIEALRSEASYHRAEVERLREEVQIYKDLYAEEIVAKAEQRNTDAVYTKQGE